MGLRGCADGGWGRRRCGPVVRSQERIWPSCGRRHVAFRERKRPRHRGGAWPIVVSDASAGPGFSSIPTPPRRPAAKSRVGRGTWNRQGGISSRGAPRDRAPLRDRDSGGAPRRRQVCPTSSDLLTSHSKRRCGVPPETGSQWASSTRTLMLPLPSVGFPQPKSTQTSPGRVSHVIFALNVTAPRGLRTVTASPSLMVLGAASRGCSHTSGSG